MINNIIITESNSKKIHSIIYLIIAIVIYFALYQEIPQDDFTSAKITIILLMILFLLLFLLNLSKKQTTIIYQNKEFQINICYLFIIKKQINNSFTKIRANYKDIYLNRWSIILLNDSKFFTIKSFIKRQEAQKIIQDINNLLNN